MPGKVLEFCIDETLKITCLTWKSPGKVLEFEIEKSVGTLYEKRAYKYEIWSYRISAKASKIAHSCVSRGTGCLKVIRSLQLAYFVLCERRKP